MGPQNCPAISIVMLGAVLVLGVTLLALADEPAPEQATQPVVPEHPTYQQILAVFADADRPMRTRDLCQALDLPIVPTNTEGIRSKLKRLVSHGILAETEPGLFTQPLP
ncbi:hypothetical protein ACWGGS_01825 [Streptomyces decoyicus]